MKKHLVDLNQNKYQLAAVQLVGMMNVPIIGSSLIVYQKHGFLNALFSLIISNLILFMVRVAVAKLGHKSRESTLDISRRFMGKTGSILVSFILLISSLMWFTKETSLAGNALAFFSRINEGENISLPIQFQVGIGILSTILCMEGIIALRRSAVILLPVILISFLSIIFLSDISFLSIGNLYFTLEGCFFGIALMVGIGLGTTVDLPTFFRHSHSWSDSLKAIFYIQVLTLILGFLGIFLGEVVNPTTGLFKSESHLLVSPYMQASLLCFILLSTVFANVTNIYSASVGWEVLAPKSLVGRSEYLVLGLGILLSYISFLSMFSVDLPLAIFDNFLVLLCSIFVIGYLVYLYSKKDPGRLDQIIYLVSFIISSVITFVMEFGFIIAQIPPLFLGVISEICLIVLGFLLKKTFLRHKKH